MATTNESIIAGDRVRLIRSIRLLGADFPGWGDPSYPDHFVQGPEGLSGVVTYVESHGSNPWRRFSVRFDDGSSSSGLCLGLNLELAR